MRTLCKLCIAALILVLGGFVLVTLDSFAQSQYGTTSEGDLATAAMPASRSSHLDRPLRIFTANIWGYAPPYEARMKLLRQQIEVLGPDVLGFEEAGWAPGEDDQVKQVLQGLGYQLDHEFYGPGGAKVVHRTSGLSVASRWPITRRALWRQPTRGTALVVEVQAPQPVGPFLFVSTNRGSWRLDGEAVREVELVDLDKRLREISNSAGFPTILVGDFDATPDSAGIRFLRGLQSLEGHSTHYLDAWTAAGNEGAGYTWTSQNLYVRRQTEEYLHTNDHHRRIDYIFVGSPHQYKGYARVVSCRVVLDHPEGDNWPSDHFGVFAEISAKR